MDVNESAVLQMEEAFACRIPLERAIAAGANEAGWRAMLRQAALLALADPFRHGYRNPVWDLAERQLVELRELFPRGVIYLLLLGGHRSGKSEWEASYVTRELCLKPGQKWWCADATEAASRDNQQRYIERYLPPEWRPGESGVLDKRRQKHTKVRYSQAGGFTENVCVLPNRSECRFKFYEQKLATLQAVALNGFWGDELLPFDWIEEIEWRLVELNGVFLISFTPYEGWTQTVAHFLEGAKVIEEVEADAELLPLLSDRRGNRNNGEVTGEKVHRVLQCVNERARVVHFHSSDNPVFGNWPGVKAKAKKLPRAQVLMRVYGMVEKGAFAQFPLFSERVHVRSRKWWESQREQWDEGERAHLVDPCSGRFWFMIWVWCPRPNSWVIYREWPSHGHPGAYIQGVGDPGPWAVAGEAHDGMQGPAQKNRGFGLERYKTEIERAEANEIILERWIDARYSHSPQQEREGTTTLIEQMVEIGMDFRAMVSESKILGVPDGSIDMINSALYYDQQTELGEFSEELGRINEPQLLVLETCPNVIYAFKNWTGKDGQVGACKDPIDVIRGMFLSQVGYMGKDMYVWKRR